MWFDNTDEEASLLRDYGIEQQLTEKKKRKGKKRKEKQCDI